MGATCPVSLLFIFAICSNPVSSACIRDFTFVSFFIEYARATKPSSIFISSLIFSIFRSIGLGSVSVSELISSKTASRQSVSRSSSSTRDSKKSSSSKFSLILSRSFIRRNLIVSSVLTIAYEDDARSFRAISVIKCLCLLGSEKVSSLDKKSEISS